ncbi:hypothetical protein AAC387_Pa06g1871 [Persea americana]
MQFSMLSDNLVALSHYILKSLHFNLMIHAVVMSPEHAMRGRFYEKSDVSFGVFLLEIVCGKRNTSFYQNELLQTFYAMPGNCGMKALP